LNANILLECKSYERRRDRNVKRGIAGFCAAIVCLLLLSFLAEGAQKGLSPQKDESLRRGETRSTLDPNLFGDGKVREAYRVAREIPWVLDSIYCYCKCEESPAFRHKSLLSCYVDKHAAV
jgi:hypothetical protein